MPAWKLPLVVAALAVPIVAAFLVGGPAIGTALGAAAVLAILVIAARQKPRGAIGEAPQAGRRRILIVVTGPVDEPAEVERVISIAHLNGETADVRVLAPARIGFLDRWASDVEGARESAQRTLVTTVAGLARAGIDAEARVGDEDFVQAVEDQLQGFRADEVILVSADAAEGEKAEPAAEELRSRLHAEFHHLVLDRGGNAQRS
jgi:hypothetical protein